jgi:hypothetical protein
LAIVRPTVTLVQYDTEPMQDQLLERLYWMRNWLIKTMDGYGYNYTEPVFVERKAEIADLMLGPDGQEGDWWWWFNTHLVVTQHLGGPGTSPTGPHPYDRCLIMAPSFRTDENPAGNGAMRNCAIVRGKYAYNMQSARRQGSKRTSLTSPFDNPGWKWAAGVVLHELLHTFQIGHAPVNPDQYVVSRRGFYLPKSSIIPAHKAHLRSVLAT